jgi:hypothetical protein
MRQLRGILLEYDFSECILHFSDAPDVVGCCATLGAGLVGAADGAERLQDIATTIQLAREYLNDTPLSCFARRGADVLFDTVRCVTSGVEFGGR